MDIKVNYLCTMFLITMSSSNHAINSLGSSSNVVTDWDNLFLSMSYFYIFGEKKVRVDIWSHIWMTLKLITVILISMFMPSRFIVIDKKAVVVFVSDGRR